MNFEEELDALTQYMPIDQLRRSMEAPQKYAPEQFERLIPAFELGTDGPTLVRVLLVSKEFICDVRLSPNDDLFDYIARDSIINYRIKLWRHGAHELAAVSLVHEMGFTFHTDLAYVGQDRDVWMDTVTSVFPTSIVSRLAR